MDLSTTKPDRCLPISCSGEHRECGHAQLADVCHTATVEGARIHVPVGFLCPARSLSSVLMASTLPADLSGSALLDVGTGTGFLAILAAIRNATFVAACDISPSCVDVASTNATSNGVGDRIMFYRSDVFESVPKDRQYDLIIGNLPIRPYVPLGFWRRKHSKVMATFLLDPGHRAFRNLLSGAKALLTDAGELRITIADFANRSQINSYISAAGMQWEEIASGAVDGCNYCVLSIRKRTRTVVPLDQGAKNGSALRVRGLSIAVGSKEIVRSVDLDVAGGEIVGIFGRSGTGKTTVLRAICGLLRERSIRQSGQVEVSSQPGDIAYISQKPSLFPWLSVRENIGLLAQLTGKEDPSADRDHSFTKKLSALLDCAPTEISGGEQQLVALARAFALRSRVMLLDEPFASLDSLTRWDACGITRQAIIERNVAALWVSHDPRELAGFADRVLVFRGGPATVWTELVVRTKDYELSHEEVEETLMWALDDEFASQ